MLVSGLGDFRILRGGSPATIQFKFRNNTGETRPITHAFATGIDFAAGEVVAIKGPIDASSPVSVYLRGYTTTAP